MHNGLDNYAYAIETAAVEDTETVYVGGFFQLASGVPANFIAKWDGQTWSALGSGTGHVVHALKMFDDGSGAGARLYAGGAFTTAGGLSANLIASWDGTTWAPVISAGQNGVSGLSRVSALLAVDNPFGLGRSLYVGGGFGTAGGVTANGIARWDGTTWSALGAGLGQVFALAWFDGSPGYAPALYAGGEFTSGGGVSAIRVAKWDGATWSRLGTGINTPSVQALAVFADGLGASPALYAGGQFQSVATGNTTRFLARWDGSTWARVGGGRIDSDVYALAPFGGALYVGGAFGDDAGIQDGFAKLAACPPHGACCFSNRLCLYLPEATCVNYPDETHWSAAYVPCAAEGEIPVCPLVACCLPDGSCRDNVSDEECSSQDGTSQGTASRCMEVSCPQPLGACCLGAGGCVDVLFVDCEQFPGSVWAGPLTSCVDGGGSAVCPLGACCLPDGACVEDLLPSACSSMGGTHRPGSVACNQANCPPPVGACCLNNGTCIGVTQSECGLFTGATWAGALTSCVDVGGTPRCPLGACCLPSGQCSGGTLQTACTEQGGAFRGPASTCANANCPQPVGACCLANGSCIALTSANCAASPGSRWAGANTTCADSDSNGRADACENVPGDINGDGRVDDADVPLFVAVLLGTPQDPAHVGRADLNADGRADGVDLGLFVEALLP